MRTLGWTTAVVLVFGCGARAARADKPAEAVAACERRVHACETDRDNKGRRVQRLESELAQAQQEREKYAKESRRLEQLVQGLKADVASRDRELAAARSAKGATDKRLEAYRQVYERIRKLADTGKLRVDFRNGMMILRLPTDVLFAPGEDRLNEEGLAALAQLTSILLEVRDRRFIVAGHTDSMEISSRAARARHFKNAWQLSAARAVTVVDFMVESGFPARNLAPAGFGAYDPIAGNDFEGDRALNRRVEIILLPDLSELGALGATGTPPAK